MAEQTPGEKPDDEAKFERLIPQLAMVRRDLANLPPVEVPEPYTLRTFREGDEPAWEEIIAESFDKPPGEYRFDGLVRNKGLFLPERVFFIVSSVGKPVATATALLKASDDPIPAALHMVGVLHKHQGKKLGYWASLAAMHQHARDGVEEITLLSDDFRLAAVKTYLRLGFEPCLVHENQRERWPKVFAALGDKGEWLAQFSHILKGPVHNTDASSR